MKRTTVKAQQAIIDQLTEQLDTAHRRIRALSQDAFMAQRERKLRMEIAKQQAMKTGSSVRVH